MTSASVKAFAENTRKLREAIERALGQYLACDEEAPAPLLAAMRHSLMGPGKRLRPLLVLMAAEACGCAYQAALPAACAVEMVHTYSLIHDDLPAMDDDDMRRGRPSCHAQFGEALAILAGDALPALAFEILARDVHPPEVAARCCAALGRAAGPRELVGGQVDDMQAESEGGDLVLLESIHRRKTGAMIRVSLQLGGLIGGASGQQMAALDAYGRRLGLAFQIKDDLLDVHGDEETMGKRLRKDSGRGKLTFPALLGLEQSELRAATLVEQACQAAAVFGPRGESLQSLAQYVVQRTR